MSRFLLLILFFSCIFIRQGSAQVTPLPHITVKGKDFVDPQGSVIQFRALNASDPDKLEREGHWNAEYFAQMARWDINLVRFPIHPAAWRERGTEGYLQLINSGIEMASAHGMYVVLDWHSIGNLRSELFQHPMYETTLAETRHFWITMAQQYGKNPNVAFFELFNEPTLAGGKHGTCT